MTRVVLLECSWRLISTEECTRCKAIKQVQSQMNISPCRPQCPAWQASRETAEAGRQHQSKHTFKDHPRLVISFLFMVSHTSSCMKNRAESACSPQMGERLGCLCSSPATSNQHLLWTAPWMTACCWRTQNPHWQLLLCLSHQDESFHCSKMGLSNVAPCWGSPRGSRDSSSLA